MKQVRLDDGPAWESTEEGLLDRRFQAGHRLFFDESSLGEESGNDHVRKRTKFAPDSQPSP